MALQTANHAHRPLPVGTFGRHLFEEDVVLPNQWSARHRRDGSSPERRLMLAVLQDAIDTWRKFARTEGTRAERLAGEAWAWISSDDMSWPFSFARICEALGLDGDRLRAGLRGWLASMIMQPSEPQAETPPAPAAQPTQEPAPEPVAPAADAGVQHIRCARRQCRKLKARDEFGLRADGIRRKSWCLECERETRAERHRNGTIGIRKAVGIAPQAAAQA